MSIARSLARSVAQPVAGGLVSGAAFTPLSLGSDLALWLDPTFGLFQERTGASATTESVADGVVGTWRARNGTINGIATEDARRGVYRATGLNGTPAVELDGLAQFYDFTTPLAAAAQNKGYVYIFAAVASANEASRSVLFGFSRNGSTTQLRAGIEMNPSDVAGTIRAGGRRLDADSFVSVSQTTAFTNDAAMVVGAEFLYASSACHLRKDGSRIASNEAFQTDGNTSNTASDAVTLGAFITNASFFDGMIGNVVVVCPSSELSAATISQIETFLSNRSGGLL